MEQVDALVLGAGPAGSATAIHLARAGTHVLLADKEAFPRDKPCGGGITARALRHVPCDVEPVVEHVVDRVRSSRRRRPARCSHEPRAVDPDDTAAPARPPSRGEGRWGRSRVPRRRSRRAARGGEDGVSAVVGGSPVRCSFLIGADGANGVVARAAGLGDGIVRGVALEGNVPWRDLDSAAYQGTAWVELGVVPGGYGWVFPKGDHANLGVGGLRAPAVFGAIAGLLRGTWLIRVTPGCSRGRRCGFCRASRASHRPFPESDASARAALYVARGYATRG